VPTAVFDVFLLVSDIDEAAAVSRRADGVLRRHERQIATTSSTNLRHCDVGV